MSESRVRENLMHGLMRGKRAKPSNLLYKEGEIGVIEMTMEDKR